MVIKQPTIKQLIDQMEKEVRPEDWYRPVDLPQRFKNLKKSTLNSYLKEMEDYSEFKQGIIKPTHSVTWINIQIFLLYLRWKEENNYKTRKTKPADFLKAM